MKHRNDGGVTLIEITIALFIMAIGILVILSLFPQGLYTTRSVVETTTAATVARGALSAILADTLDGDLDDTGADGDLRWATGYDGGAGDGWWPPAPPQDVSFTGTIRGEQINGNDCEVRVSNIGEWDTTGHTKNITEYFLLITSGEAKGRVYAISSFSKNPYTDGDTSDDTVVVPGDADHTVSLAADGVAAGDSFELIGPGAVAPQQAITVGTAPNERTLYWWFAVVGNARFDSPVDSGTITDIAGNLLTDENKHWAVTAFEGMSLYISSGTGSPQWVQIVTNDKKSITVNGWGPIGPPAVGSSFTIYDSAAGLHDVYIFVLGKDFEGTASNLRPINWAIPSGMFKGTIWQPGA